MKPLLLYNLVRLRNILLQCLFMWVGFYIAFTILFNVGSDGGTLAQDGFFISFSVNFFILTTILFHLFSYPHRFPMQNQVHRSAISLGAIFLELLLTLGATTILLLLPFNKGQTLLPPGDVLPFFLLYLTLVLITSVAYLFFFDGFSEGASFPHFKFLRQVFQAFLLLFSFILITLVMNLFFYQDPEWPHLLL